MRRQPSKWGTSGISRAMKQGWTWADGGTCAARLSPGCSGDGDEGAVLASEQGMSQASMHGPSCFINNCENGFGQCAVVVFLSCSISCR